MHDLDDLVDIFELLGDWEQRYQYLVELGEGLPAMPQALKTDDHKVRGCMSQVWVCARRSDKDPAHLVFYGDCDTSIIKGVLALLIQLSKNKTSAEVQALDVDVFFNRLGLDEHLSPNRHVGIYAILDLMKQQARALSGGSRDAA